MVLFDLRRSAEAEVEFTRAVAEEPDFGSAWAMLASTQSDQGKYSSAYDAVTNAIRLEPDSSYCHYVLAIIRLGTGEIDEGKQALDEAQRIDPVNPEYFALRSFIYLVREQWWQAKVSADEGLANDPHHVGCLKCLIESLNELELFREAESVVNHLLSIDPELAEVHRHKGWLDFRKGQIASSLDAFRYSVARDPRFGDGFKTFENIARRDGNVISAFLASVPHVLHLSSQIQFLLIALPTAAYLVSLMVYPESTLLWRITGSWAAITIAAFGYAFIVRNVLSVAMELPLIAKSQAGDEPFSEKLAGWIGIGLMWLGIGYVYLFIALSPLFSRYVGAGSLVAISATLGYRAVRSLLVRAAYSSRPQSGLLLRYLLNINIADVRIMLGCSAIAGLIAAMFWARFDYKPGPPRRVVPQQRNYQPDLVTGELIDDTGKRYKMSETFRRLYGLKSESTEPGQRDATSKSVEE